MGSCSLPFGLYGNQQVSIGHFINLHPKIYKVINFPFKNICLPEEALWKAFPCHLAHVVTYRVPWGPYKLVYKKSQFILFLSKRISFSIGVFWKAFPCHLAHMVTHRFPYEPLYIGIQKFAKFLMPYAKIQASLQGPYGKLYLAMWPTW